MLLRKRNVALACIAGSALLSLLGCSAVASGPHEEPAAPSETEQVLELLTAEVPEPVWHTDVVVAGSGPKLADGVLVSYIIEGEALFLAGFSAETGEELWKTPASPSSKGFTTMVAPELFRGESGAALAVNALAPVEVQTEGTSSYVHPLQVIDVLSGEIVSEAQLGWTGLQASDCGVEFAGCLRVGMAEGGWAEAVIDEIGGRLGSPVSSILPEMDRIKSYSQETGVFVGTIGESAAVARVVDGEKLWHLELNALGFAGAVPYPENSTADMNELQVWPVGSFMAQEVVVVTGFIGTPPIGQELPYTPTTAGIDATTGEVLWTQKGKTCGQALCVGDTTWSVDPDSYRIGFAPADHEMIGLDARTGEAQWTIEIPDYQLAETGSVFVPGHSTMLIEQDGHKILNTDTGELFPLPEGAVMPCHETSGAFFTDYQYSNPTNEMGNFEQNYVSAACDASGNGKADPSQMTRAVVVGTQLEEFDTPSFETDVLGKRMRIVSLKDGLAAYTF